VNGVASLMARLTYESVTVRPVLVPLRRPIVSKVGEYREWPLILIDLHTREGVTGRSYLQPYLRQAARYVVPAIEDLAAAREGKPVRPLDDFDEGRRSLNLVGYEGVSMIAVSGLDMAAWDALAKAADLPLAGLLGGSAGPVAAYNSNGLWLDGPGGLDAEAGELLADGGFSAVKMRLGYDRLADDLLAIDTVRNAAGDDVTIMVDYNQGLPPLRQPCSHTGASRRLTSGISMLCYRERRRVPLPSCARSRTRSKRCAVAQRPPNSAARRRSWPNSARPASAGHGARPIRRRALSCQQCWRTARAGVRCGIAAGGGRSRRGIGGRER
jgi:Mandelate racemase / muconate lactonizing enzyme, N-terminal domain/Enolase C-terminal domain-like